MNDFREELIQRWGYQPVDGDNPVAVTVWLLTIEHPNLGVFKFDVFTREEEAFKGWADAHFGREISFTAKINTRAKLRGDAEKLIDAYSKEGTPKAKKDLFLFMAQHNTNYRYSLQKRVVKYRIARNLPQGVSA